MKISIGKVLFTIDKGISKLDFRIPFIRIGKFDDGEGGYDCKFHVDLTTYIGYTVYDYGNSFTFMILGFGIDYWWTDKLEACEEELLD